MPEIEVTPDPTEDFGVPRHVAIIMDGNGRWAAQRGLPRAEGHRRGVEALHAIEARAKSGVNADEAAESRAKSPGARARRCVT